MITAQEFDQLSYSEKGALVFPQGEYISQIVYKGQIRALYALYDLLVEASFDKTTQEICDLERLPNNHSRVEKYFMEVDLDMLFV